MDKTKTPSSRPWWGEFVDSANQSRWFVVLCSVALLGSLLFGAITHHCANFVSTKGEISKNCCSQQQAEQKGSLSPVGTVKAGILMIWILSPPIWFFLEYFGIEKPRLGKVLAQGTASTSVPDDIKFSWEHFKYRQDVTSKLWLALVTALTILYFGKDLKP